MICHNISIHICGACTTTMCTVLRFQRINMPLKSGTLPYSNLNTDNCRLELQANQTTSSRLHLPHHADGCLAGNKVFIKPCCLLPQNVCCAFHGEKLEFTIRTVYRKCSYDNKGPPRTTSVPWREVIVPLYHANLHLSLLKSQWRHSLPHRHDKHNVFLRAWKVASLKICQFSEVSN